MAYSLPISFDRGPLPADVSSRIYCWADRPARAVVLRNRSLARLKPIGGGQDASGLPVYLHGQRPCIYATIAGIVVSVTERDWRWEYAIDDGTQVIEVTIQSRKIPSGIAIERPCNSSRFASSSAFTLDDISTMVPSIETFDILKVTGKIWRRQIVSDMGRVRYKVGLDACDVEVLNDDPTGEARHCLDAHRLETTDYAQRFVLPDEALSLVQLEMPAERAPWQDTLRTREETRLIHQEKFNTDLYRLYTAKALGNGGQLGRSSPIPPARRAYPPASVASRTPSVKRDRTETMPLAPIHNSSSVQRATKKMREASIAPDTRRLKPVNSIASPPSSMPLPIVKQESADRMTPPPSVTRGSTAPPDSPGLEIVTVKTSSTSRRQLRTPSKMRDSECTPSNLRLHVQKFLSDHCRSSIAYGGTDQPPTFTLRLLLRVKTLLDLAIRVSDRELRKRDQQLKRMGAPDQPPRPSGEPRSEKTKRLVEWCLRQLLKDGYIVLSQGAASEAESLDDRIQLHSEQESAPIQALDKLEKLLYPEDHPALPHSGLNSGECYQLLTPALLVNPVRDVMTRLRYRGMPEIDYTAATEQLRRTDQQWAYLNVDSVKEAAALLTRS